MNEERLRILHMVQDGLISADEGAKLLAALGEESPRLTTAALATPSRPRWFRIRVSDSSTGRMKVNINMPLSLVDFGLKIGGVSGIDVDDLRAALQQTQGGKIVDVQDEEDGEHVEIFVE
ncbi:MAG: hypothetical protein J5I90_02570 [Caldilineales bacterium]|nr:hypothetical protein [Caldilineales bacterium]